MIWYKNTDNGNFYRIKNNKVLFRRDSGMWAKHDSLTPHDLTLPPFKPVNMSK